MGGHEEICPLRVGTYGSKPPESPPIVYICTYVRIQCVILYSTQVGQALLLTSHLLVT